MVRFDPAGLFPVGFSHVAGLFQQAANHRSLNVDRTRLVRQSQRKLDLSCALKKIKVNIFKLKYTETKYFSGIKNFINNNYDIYKIIDKCAVISRNVQVAIWQHFAFEAFSTI